MKLGVVIAGAGLGALVAVRAGAAPYPVVVNECATGSSGWIELLNRGSVALELARDPARCWLVDDGDGGGPPKAITDVNVIHAAGSTTCQALGRGAGCGAIGPGERVWIRYAYVNAKTPDQCRFVSAPRAGTLCSAALGASATVADPGGPTASRSAGTCFGRTPDGGAWASNPIACTQGAPNAACSPGASCDDGNPCTTGETFSATCACTGGTPTTGNCGAGKTCQAGVCAPTPTTQVPVIVRQGTSGLILAGTIVTPDAVIEGEVWIADSKIRCVAPSCRVEEAAAAASIVQTNGIIYPGFIDTHNHIQFDIFDETDWAPEPTDNFTNHDQWPARARYKAMVDAKQYLNGEGGSPVSIGCELLKYGELKGLIAGTTSIVGAAIPTNKACYGSLARTIDQSPNGLKADKVQAATIFPTRAADADRVCENLASGKTDAYLIHIAEGVDDTARREFQKLYDVTTVDGCLFSPKTTIVHGTALEEPDFARMAAHGMSLVWSPRSNVFLYGHGTDLAKTTNIPAALELGITVALAPDWSIGGSQNILDEVRFADWVDSVVWADAITPKQLVEMVTKNPARILGLQDTLGRIAPGLEADLVVVTGDRTRPYDAILQASPKTVQLVLVGGEVLYGAADLRGLGRAEPGCDALDVCGVPKFACVAAPGGTPANRFGQSLADIRQTIETELRKYDDKNLTPWDFSPIAPLYKCP